MIRSYALAKRSTDLAMALAALLVAGLVIGISALVVWLEDRSASPFIRQERIGRGERPFLLLKLRSMRAERFRDGRKLTDAERMLHSGAFFRKYSVDELPQLVNVILGQMSLIGPRPMPIAYLPYFTPVERRRHSVRPGMSGLAQVNGRNFLTWEQKFALDVAYVERFGPHVDFEIFLKTLCRIVRPNDVGVRGADLPVISLHEERRPWSEVAADDRHGDARPVTPAFANIATAERQASDA